LLKGSIKRWDSQVNYSYVSIELLQKQAPLSGKREIEFSAMTWDDFKYWVTSGWNRVLSSIVSFFQWLAIALLVSAPVIIPLLLIIFIIIAVYRKRKKTRLKKREAESAKIMPENPEIVAHNQNLYQDMYQDNQQNMYQDNQQNMYQDNQQNMYQDNQQNLIQNADQSTNKESDQAQN